MAVKANDFHEIIYPWTDPAGATWQDYGLSYSGIHTGMQISMGAIRPNQLGDVIRNSVGTNSGGFPMLGLLTTLIPLPGNWDQ
jgi:hypothetical protein